MKTRILIFFVITLTLSSRFIWSERVLIYHNPDVYVNYWDMCVDYSGAVHVVWNESYGSNNSQVFLSSSYYAGDSWSVPFNVSQSDTSALGSPSIGVGGDGRIYITYDWNSGGYPILMLKEFDGSSWSEPSRLDSNAYSFNSKFVTDIEGRIYHFWSQWGTTKYRYKDIFTEEWTDINYSANDIYVMDVAVDDQNDLHVVGLKSYVFAEDHRAVYIKYDKQLEEWLDFTDLDSMYSHSEKICISDDGRIHVVLEERNYNQTDWASYYTQKALTDSVWFDLEPVTDFISPKIIHMYSDMDSTPHIILNYPSIPGDDMHDLKRESSTLWSDEVYYYPETGGLIRTVDNNTLYMFDIDTEDDGRYLYFLKTTGTGIEENNYISEFKLYQNYPNPFNNQTNIKYSLKNNAEVELNIYNIKGEFVANLVKAKKSRGHYTISFISNNLNSGVYFYTMNVNGKLISSKKMLYLK